MIKRAIRMLQLPPNDRVAFLLLGSLFLLMTFDLFAILRDFRRYCFNGLKLADNFTWLRASQPKQRGNQSSQCLQMPAFTSKMPKDTKVQRKNPVPLISNDLISFVNLPRWSNALIDLKLLAELRLFLENANQLYKKIHLNPPCSNCKLPTLTNNTLLGLDFSSDLEFAYLNAWELR